MHSFRMTNPMVLIVEDDNSIRNLIQTTLKAHNYRYISAPDGEAAILEASTHNPDVMFLDLGLPDMDGIDIIERVRSWTDMPIIVISARTEDTEKSRLWMQEPMTI